MSKAEFKQDVAPVAAPAAEVESNYLILTDREFRTYAISQLRRMKHWADIALQEMPGLRGGRRMIECISTQAAEVSEVARRRPLEK